MADTSQKFSDAEIAALKGLGWDFVPTGPNEWKWMKFDGPGNRAIAQQGSATWRIDVQNVAGPVEVVGGTFSTWIPTMELRWEHQTKHGFPVSMVLQQKWRRTISGPESVGSPTEWRDIPTVDSNGESVE